MKAILADLNLCYLYQIQKYVEAQSFGKNRTVFFKVFITRISRRPKCTLVIEARL